MKVLSSFELLRIWEEETDHSLIQKTIRLLCEAFEEDAKTIAHLSIGQRDARMLQLREWMFGSRLRHITNCPQCKDTIEWETNTSDLKFQSITPEPVVDTYTLDKDGYTIRFRLPDSYDMARAIADPAYHTDQKKMIADCILEKRLGSANLETHEIPGQIWNALDEEMERKDPQADIQMNILCPSCSHQWSAGFDIVAFLWAEIKNWAHRVMQDVYLLAHSFGWSEKDILNMSARRRQLYIQMLTA